MQTHRHACACLHVCVDRRTTSIHTLVPRSILLGAAVGCGGSWLQVWRHTRPAAPAAVHALCLTLHGGIAAVGRVTLPWHPSPPCQPLALLLVSRAWPHPHVPRPWRRRHRWWRGLHHFRMAEGGTSHAALAGCALTAWYAVLLVWSSDSLSLAMPLHRCMLPSGSSGAILAGLGHHRWSLAAVPRHDGLRPTVARAAWASPYRNGTKEKADRFKFLALIHTYPPHLPCQSVLQTSSCRRDTHIAVMHA